MEKMIVYGFTLMLAVVACNGNPAGGDTGALDVVDKIKELIHTSETNDITKREKTPGFEFLNMYATVSKTKGLKAKHILKRARVQLKPFVQDDARLKFVYSMLLEYLRDEVEEHGEQSFIIFSSGGKGSTKALFVYYKLRDDGKYNYKSMLFEGQFKLAASLVITRSSKKGFFSSSSKDVINYLPRRGITDQDVQSLLTIVVPQINKVMGGFLPTDEDGF